MLPAHSRELGGHVVARRQCRIGQCGRAQNVGGLTKGSRHNQSHRDVGNPPRVDIWLCYWTTPMLVKLAHDSVVAPLRRYQTVPCRLHKGTRQAQTAEPRKADVHASTDACMSRILHVPDAPQGSCSTLQAWVTSRRGAQGDPLSSPACLSCRAPLLGDSEAQHPGTTRRGCYCTGS